MKLLIADSDPLILKSLQIALVEHEDITVAGLTSDSMEAMDMCKTHEPSVVLMDIRMSDTDTTRLIKKRHPDIHLITFANFDTDPHIQKIINAGADGYLAKSDRIPLILDKLRNMVMARSTTVIDN